jgi:hypothetical protein
MSEALETTPVATPVAKPRTKKAAAVPDARWLGVDAVHAYFGGMISRANVEELMKSNHIKSRWVKGRLCAHIKDVEQWDDDIRRAKDTYTTRLLGADFIVPVAYILNNETGKRGAR